MKLYVCWTTAGGKVHACARAYDALRQAGHDPEIVKVKGMGVLPEAFNGGRKEVIELTGQRMVPVLVPDEGEHVVSSGAIAEWASAHPRT